MVDKERRMPQKLGNWIPVLLPVLITLIGITSTYAVLGYRVVQAENDIKQMQEQNVSREVLDLSLEPIKQDGQYTKENIKDLKDSVRRLESSTWEMLQYLKANNGVPRTGSHN